LVKHQNGSHNQIIVLAELIFYLAALSLAAVQALGVLLLYKRSTLAKKKLIAERKNGFVINPVTSSSY
jgi:hypothetical protein